MDAVLHPKLDRLDFKQEGWRLEHQVPTGTLRFSKWRVNAVLNMQFRYDYANSVQGCCIQRNEGSNSEF